MNFKTWFYIAKHVSDHHDAQLLFVESNFDITMYVLFIHVPVLLEFPIDAIF